MANVLNGTATGSGGLISTGDKSGVLNIQTNETTAISIATDQSVTFSSTISATGVSGNAVATQANQETATSTATIVTPGRQQYHPSAAKAWIMYNGTGTVAILASYNVTSLTDNAAGKWTVSYTVAFSSANYGAALIASIYNDSAGKAILTGLRDTDNPVAGSITIQTLDPSVTSNPDCQRVGLVCFGDQ